MHEHRTHKHACVRVRAARTTRAHRTYICMCAQTTSHNLAMLLAQDFIEETERCVEMQIDALGQNGSASDEDYDQVELACESGASQAYIQVCTWCWC